MRTFEADRLDAVPEDVAKNADCDSAYDVDSLHNKAMFQEQSIAFGESREYEALGQALHRCQAIESITKVVCFDLDYVEGEAIESDAEPPSSAGSPAPVPAGGDDESDESDAGDAGDWSDVLLKHVAALQLAKYVETRTERKIALLSQARRLQPLFKQMLTERGFSICKSAEGNSHGFVDVDANSLVIGLATRLPFRSVRADIARPAMMFTDFSGTAAQPAERGLVTSGTGPRESRRDPLPPRVRSMYDDYQAIPWASECCASPQRCDDALHSAWLYQHKKHDLLDGPTPGRGSRRSPRRYRHRLQRPPRITSQRCIARFDYL